MAVGMNWERLTPEQRGAVMHYFASVYGCRPELAFTLARKSVNGTILNFCATLKSNQQTKGNQ